MERRAETSAAESVPGAGTVILEDDPYGELRFTPDRVPSIAALEGETEHRLVAYTSTFSKTVAPGLRTGWTVADRQIIGMMARAKQSADLHTSVLDQLILSEMLLPEVFKLDDHIHKLSSIYKERMETMEAELSRSIWSRLRLEQAARRHVLLGGTAGGLDAKTLLTCAVDKGVTFVPGTPFYAGEPKRNTMRLNFSFAEPDVIRTGMERLSEAASEFLGRYAGE